MGKLRVLALAAVSLARTTAAAIPDVLWTIRNFDFHASYIFTTPAHQNSWGYVNFTLASNLVSYTTSCTANSNRLNDFFYGETAYACAPADEAPLGAAANFKFDRPNGRLYVEETFVQGDGQESTILSGVLNVTTTCSDKTVSNENWKLGEVYSQRDVRCAAPDVTFPAIKSDD